MEKKSFTGPTALNAYSFKNSNYTKLNSILSSPFTHTRTITPEIKINYDNFKNKKDTHAEQNINKDYQTSLYKAFQSLDINNTGVIKAQELAHLLQEIQWEEPDSDLFEIINKLKTGPLHLSISNFTDIMGVNQCNFNTFEDSRTAFTLFEDNNHGYISLESLRLTCEKYGETQLPQDLLSMIQVADSDGDYFVTLEDFHKIIHKKI